MVYKPDSKVELVALLYELSGKNPVFVGKGNNVVFGPHIKHPIVVISKGLDHVHIFENKNEVHLSVLKSCREIAISGHGYTATNWLS